MSTNNSENLKMAICWEGKLQAWIDQSTGRLIAPRQDEDGIDFFFVLNASDKAAFARFCSGENYWAYGAEKTANDPYWLQFMGTVKYLNTWSDKFAQRAAQHLPVIKTEETEQP